MVRRRTVAVASAIAAGSVVAIAALVWWPQSDPRAAFEANRPSEPVDVRLDGRVLTWAPPERVVPEEPVVSYAVVYRPAGSAADVPWSVYARGSSAQAIDLGDGTLADCRADNPSWECALTGGDLAPGTAFEVRVVARTPGTLGLMSAPVVAP